MRDCSLSPSVSSSKGRGCTRPPSLQLPDMTGSLYPLPLNGTSSFLQNEGGHRTFYIHPPPINKKICLTSFNSRSILQCSGEETRSPLSAPPHTQKNTLVVPSSYSSPPPAVRDPGVRPGRGMEMRRYMGDGSIEVGGETEEQL